MAVTVNPKGKLRPRLYKLTGVKIFMAGTVRGKHWSPAEIRQMADNGNRYGHLIRPTVVIGHEEHQPLTHGMSSTALQNTGEPAYGRIDRLRAERDGKDTFLVGDFRDVPGWLARLLAGRHFIDRSAEIYEEPPDGLEHVRGPILRRVSLLGAELPQVKQLGQLPEPEVQSYADSSGTLTVTPRRHLLRLAECRDCRGPHGTRYTSVRCREVRPPAAPGRSPMSVTPAAARAALERAGMGSLARFSDDRVVVQVFNDHRADIAKLAERPLGTSTAAAPPFPQVIGPTMRSGYDATAASQQPGTSTTATPAPTRTPARDGDPLVRPGARGTAAPEAFDDTDTGPGPNLGATGDEAVSRQELIEALVDFGMDPSVLTEDVPDEVLEEYLRVLLADRQGNGGEAPEGMAPEGMAPEGQAGTGQGNGGDIDDSMVRGYAELHRDRLLKVHRLSVEQFSDGFRAFRRNHRHEYAGARPGQRAAAFLGLHKH
jgi:hypothetical protein